MHRGPGARHRRVVGNAVREGAAADGKAVGDRLRRRGSVDHQLHLARPDRIHAMRASLQDLVDDRDLKAGVANTGGGAPGGQYGEAHFSQPPCDRRQAALVGIFDREKHGAGLRQDHARAEL